MKKKITINVYKYIQKTKKVLMSLITKRKFYSPTQKKKKKLKFDRHVRDDVYHALERWVEECTGGLRYNMC